ncbi:MAG: hypothetical protein HWE20_09010 [Gammaproteobacteria bacterium]|nr:hypothetical protein [Gammaproteobacteria bacterium]
MIAVARTIRKWLEITALPLTAGLLLIGAAHAAPRIMAVVNGVPYLQTEIERFLEPGQDPNQVLRDLALEQLLRERANAAIPLIPPELLEQARLELLAMDRAVNPTELAELVKTELYIQTYLSDAVSITEQDVSDYLVNNPQSASANRIEFVTIPPTSPLTQNLPQLERDFHQYGFTAVAAQLHQKGLLKGGQVKLTAQTPLSARWRAELAKLPLGSISSAIATTNGTAFIHKPSDGKIVDKDAAKAAVLANKRAVALRQLERELIEDAIVEIKLPGVRLAP